MAFRISCSVSELGGGNCFLRLLLGVDVGLALVEGIVASLRCFSSAFANFRVKAFHCGEYDECIEKAKASAAKSNKKAVKYARREDAIIHALELESAPVGKEPLVFTLELVRIEARGFIFGPPIALAIGAKLVPLRKPKKLPDSKEGCIIGLMTGKVISQEYILEYGRDCLEMHVGAVEAGERAIVVDDLIATGGTLCAAMDLLGYYFGCQVYEGFADIWSVGCIVIEMATGKPPWSQQYQQEILKSSLGFIELDLEKRYTLKAAIVTCGGLCPGLNGVIRQASIGMDNLNA
ncbi:hypothetical protein Ahy_A07g035239 [Arachis hypogaea]|uniref:adenine phosphoribosyltransferase n=1 Tax=Arachis hypogaea TaxID=3818 RepID=A0A445CDH3_ARAHY|nr:hypothetical protein Ahy_A07g035239 [Arachis hypogaea]